MTDTKNLENESQIVTKRIDLTKYHRLRKAEVYNMDYIDYRILFRNYCQFGLRQNFLECSEQYVMSRKIDLLEFLSRIDTFFNLAEDDLQTLQKSIDKNATETLIYPMLASLCGPIFSELEDAIEHLTDEHDSPFALESWFKAKVFDYYIRIKRYETWVNNLVSEETMLPYSGYVDEE